MPNDDIARARPAFLDEERLVVRSPRSAAIAGLLFALLFSVSVIILKISVSDVRGDTGEWLANKAGWVTFAIGLMPFAGIFFLWFMGVVRARLGRFEDQFFSTVFQGSGLIFLAMVFVASGIAGGLIAGFARDPSGFPGSSAYYLGRDLITQIFGIYAMRMAAVFLISQATLWLRTKVMPRWLIFLTYPLALVLLFVFTRSFWIILVFPAWVFLVSVYILIVSFVRPRRAAGDGTATETPEPAASE
jgi:hypothetical protein